MFGSTSLDLQLSSGGWLGQSLRAPVLHRGVADASQGRGDDCLQRPLLRRSRFQQLTTSAVRREGPNKRKQFSNTEL